MLENTIIPDENEVLFHERWDRTHQLTDEKNSWKKTLDRLCRIMEAGSKCVAMAVYNKRLMIASNDPFPAGAEKTDSKNFSVIHGVMVFLSQLARKELEIYSDNYQSQFLQVLALICEGAAAGLLLGAQFKALVTTENFIRHVINAEKTNNYSSLHHLCQKNTELKHSAAALGSAFVTFISLLKDFEKVISFICDNEQHSLTQAVAQYKKSNIIFEEDLPLNLKDKTTMHAEMRILSMLKPQLGSKKDSVKLYIGLSKLCCLSCGAMICALNCEEYNNIIEIRGAHNVAHDKNWNPPFGITGVPPKLQASHQCSTERVTRTTAKNNKDPFTEKIAALFNNYHQKAVRKTEEKGTCIIGTSGVSQTADDSDGEEEYSTERIKIFVLKIQENLSVLKACATLSHISAPVNQKLIITLEQFLNDANTKGTALRSWLYYADEAYYYSYLVQHQENWGLIEDILSKKHFVGEVNVKLYDEVQEKRNKEMSAAIKSSKNTSQMQEKLKRKRTNVLTSWDMNQKHTMTNGAERRRTESPFSKKKVLNNEDDIPMRQPKKSHSAYN